MEPRSGLIHQRLDQLPADAGERGKEPTIETTTLWRQGATLGTACTLDLAHAVGRRICNKGTKLPERLNQGTWLLPRGTLLYVRSWLCTPSPSPQAPLVTLGGVAAITVRRRSVASASRLFSAHLLTVRSGRPEFRASDHVRKPAPSGHSRHYRCRGRVACRPTSDSSELLISAYPLDVITVAVLTAAATALHTGLIGGESAASVQDTQKPTPL